MKFLCVPCDEPMQLLETRPPDRGSITLVYSCAACGYEFAMLTNPFETQVVGSLGVKIGPDSAAAPAAASPEGAASSGGASKCPFTGIVQQMGGAAAPPDDAVRWTDDASERLASLPEFVRPMAKTGIEKWARDKGYAAVDARVLDEAKKFFGM